ncbi:Alpha/Beta hydrolase protein [Xylaria bambusicola]|uniref:Alpha/Beta hydrolase protein n=1 Tax=Xylaria bambusicola TaxID=326684 RepID=UPI0020081DA2|nr:Alpha/Beta hydrolase protein [Xylaria bambusicola]KAI0513264.1 Alpha/Beta hydrolase protein [Xylaria bambusicola]
MAPLLVLVPGAFGTTEGFNKMASYLGAIKTHPRSYPSCNPPDPLNADCSNDIAVLKDTLLSLLDQGLDLVVLAHSYGGVVAGGAAKGLDKDSRKAAGYENAVLGLIYVAGNITLEGETLFEAVGGAYPPFIKSNKPSEGLALIEPAMQVLYNDCEPDPELDRFMKPHALKAFETKSSAPAWQDEGFNRRRLYIRTVKDQCNPSFLQDSWIEKSGVEWDVVNFDTGHMPFVSQPEALAEQIVKFVREVMES